MSRSARKMSFKKNKHMGIQPIYGTSWWCNNHLVKYDSVVVKKTCLIQAMKNH